MDLLDLASIDAFADRYLASGQPLHILVNSAGIMACPLARDSRGYESQFATNQAWRRSARSYRRRWRWADSCTAAQTPRSNRYWNGVQRRETTNHSFPRRGSRSQLRSRNLPEGCPRSYGWPGCRSRPRCCWSDNLAETVTALAHYAAWQSRMATHQESLLMSKRFL